MENELFLALCFGGPVVMVVALFWMAARQFFGPSLAKIASELGWTANPHADFLFRYEAVADGVRWQFAQRGRSHRRHSAGGPLEFSVDLGRSPGVLVMRWRLCSPSAVPRPSSRSSRESSSFTSQTGT